MCVGIESNIKDGDHVIVKENIEIFGRIAAQIGDVFEVKKVTHFNIEVAMGGTTLRLDHKTFWNYFEKIEPCTCGNLEDMGEQVSDERDASVEVIYSTGDHLPNKVTQEMVDEIIEDAEIVVDTLFDRMTIVSCKLPNGFIITETSACIDPENYNEDMGIDICMDKIITKIYKLETYRLMNEIYESKRLDTWINCKDNKECNECPYVNECLYEDEQHEELYDYEIDECFDCEDKYTCESSPHKK